MLLVTMSMRARAVPLLCALYICWLAGATRATAQTSSQQPSVVVLHQGAGEGRPADRQRLLEQLGQDEQLKGSSLQVISGADLQRQMEGQRQGWLLQRALVLAREGWLLVGHLKYKQAISRLGQSLNVFAVAQQEAGTCQAATIAVRDMAYAQWQLGNKGRAAALVAATEEIDGPPVDSTRYPPPFLGFINSREKTPAVELTLISRPTPAEVWVNCRRRGPSPQTLSIQGGVMVQVNLAGRRTWGRWIDAGQSSQLVTAELTEAPSLAGADAEELSLALHASGSRRLILWQRKGDRLELRSFQSGQQQPRIWRVLTVKQAPPPARTRQVVGDRPRPGRRGLAPWLVAGGAALTLATGSIFGYLAHDARGQIEEAASRGEMYDAELADLDSRRQDFGSAAYVLWGVGTAAAVGALVLWLWSDEPAENAAGGFASSIPGAMTWRW